MATFGELQASVSSRLLDPNNTSVSASEVANSINEAIKYWKFRRFEFNERVAALTLNEQDAIIPTDDLGDPFLVPVQDNDGFNIEYSAMRYPLGKISQQIYDNLYLSNGYGLPQYYTRIADVYRVYPIPDRDYTINCHYLCDYPALVSADETNDFTEHAEELILMRALKKLSAEFRQDMDMAKYYSDQEQDEYRNLRVLSDKANGAGKLTLHSNFIF